MVLKFIFSLAFTLWQLPSFAQHGNHQCNHNSDGVIECLASEDHKTPNDLAHKYLEWWAASSLQVKNAKCQNAGAPSVKEMTDFINRKKSDKLVSESFHGINIENEDPHLIERLKQLTTYDPLFSFKKDESKQTQYNIPQTCNKVLCAAESIFGKDRALKLLYALDRFELNLSHHTDDNLADWKANEIDLILEAVDDLPAHLIPFERNQYLKHYKRGYGPSLSTVANATITVFSVWEDLPNDQERMSALIHEIGHNIGNRLKQDESKQWHDLSGWVEKDGTWTASKDDQIVSKYGMTNPAEDFAETFIAFRYNPALLKQMSPTKYDYMKKNVFLNLEYDTEEKCQNKHSKLAHLKNEVSIKNAPMPENYGGCKKELAKIVQKQDVNLKSCIKKMKFHDEIQKKLDPTNENENYAVLQALAFEEYSDSEITEEEEAMAYQKIIGDIYGSITKHYNNYSGEECSSIKEYGWQSFITFNQYALGGRYEQLMDNKSLNNFVANICTTLKGQQQVNCQDLKKFMTEHIPARLTITAPTQSEKPANDFRCPM
jgi:hypothetical protein